MDFYQHQWEARAKSRQLISIFTLGVVLLVVAINVVGVVVWRYATSDAPLPAYFVVTNSLVVLLYVLGGAWLEWTRLAQGGAAIAHRIGARNPDAYDLRHQRLVNVCEEISIAAGIPVPEVFVLDHDGINALTAGHQAGNCALVVSRGALEYLTRAQLQALVAHEVAHIVNGDVALNTRLAGALYGLYSLSMMGRAMLAAPLRHSRERHSRSNAPLPLLLVMMVAGAVLTVLGSFAAFCGRIVQAGISRQREYLADAQAVQFTRDQHAMGAVLRKITGQQHSAIESDYADVVQHLWLSDSRDRHGWLDSHPPLIARIRRIYGRPLPPILPELVEVPAQDFDGRTGRGDAVSLARFGAAGKAFAADPEDLALVEPWVKRSTVADDDVPVTIDPQAESPASLLIAAAREPKSSLSQVALLLNAIVAGPVSLSADDGLESSGECSNGAMLDALMWLEQPQAQWLRVPLIEMLSARLRSWPLECRHTLVRYCHDAVLADGRIEKTEWIYFTLVRHRLLPELDTHLDSVSALDKRKALAELFSMAGKLSDQSPRRLRDAVASAALLLDVTRPAATPEQFEFRSLTRALDVLRSMAPLSKPALLKILSSLPYGSGNAVYEGFLAAIAAAIDCPPLRLQPSLASQSVEVAAVTEAA